MSRWMLCLLLACSTLAEAAAAAGDRCRVRLLGELGWRIERAAIAVPEVQAGQPCRRADLADARRHGDLRIVLPAGDRLQQHPALLRRLLDDPASRCAFRFRVAAATRRAIDRLAGNPGFRFTWLQFGWIGFGFGGPGIDGWRQTASFGRAFVPADGNWRAIRGFYDGRVRAECGVGRQIAQYATLAELFGPRFDTAFESDEIVIGRYRQLADSDSVLLGRHAGRLVHDGDGRRAAARGRQALVGLPGFIVHVKPRRYLDDINNQAQNFVVYDVSAEAAASLAEQHGFEVVNDKAEQLWRLAATLPDPGRHGFERLLYRRDARARAQLSARDRATVARIDALLADPFFSGVRLYVHHRGVRPAGYHFIRMLDRNPRTPYRIEFALYNLPTTWFQRWRDDRLAACGA